jgi:hypothetical protein
MNGGSGKISMVKIHTITTGIASDCHGMSIDSCRRSDNVRELDAISLKKPCSMLKILTKNSDLS